MESKFESRGKWSDLAVYNESNVVKHYSFDFWNTIAKSNAVFKSSCCIFKPFIILVLTLTSMNVFREPEFYLVKN